MSPDPSAPMDSAGFAAVANVSRETLTRLEDYADRLRHWQARINLIGRTTVADLWRRHFLDSWQLGRFVPADAQSLTDLGAGAGFPGLVLAIVLGKTVHLVESDQRKAVFLREVAHRTGAPVAVHAGRIEDVATWPTDVVVARALTSLDGLLTYAACLRIPGENPPLCLFPKGATAQEELTQAQEKWHILCESAPSITDPVGRVLIIRNFSPIQRA